MKSEHATIRIGIIGFGLAGAVLHAPLIEAVNGLRIVAVASSRSDEVTRRLPGVRSVADPAELIEAADVDLVVIASPNDSHAPLARLALAAGKHVVVDKPFVLDPQEGEALVALASDLGRLLTVFHNRRWDSDFLTVQQLVQAGTLGKIVEADMHWDRFRPAIKPGWREAAEQGSGVLADLGPHLIDQALQLFGWPVSVTADIDAQREGARADDMFTLTLGYPGMRVTLASSSLIAAARPRFALYGLQGAFVKYGLDQQEAALREGRAPGDEGFGDEKPDDCGVLTGADGVATSLPSQPGRWIDFYRGVVAAIVDGVPPPVDPRDAIAGLHIIDGARRSASERRTIDLDPRAAL